MQTKGATEEMDVNERTMANLQPLQLRPEVTAFEKAMMGRGGRGMKGWSVDGHSPRTFGDKPWSLGTAIR